MKRLPLFAAGLAAVVMTACIPPTGGNNPVVIGDSIVMGAQLHGAMNRMPDAFIDADPGRGIYGKGIGTGRNGIDTVPSALSHLTSAGGWLVVELGTNGLETDPPEFYRANIFDMLQAIPPGVCVAWVTVWNGRTSYTRSLSYAWNLAVRDQLIKWRSCYRVIDWYAEASYRVDLTGVDQVHPTTLGEMVLAELIDNAT